MPLLPALSTLPPWSWRPGLLLALVVMAGWYALGRARRPGGGQGRLFYVGLALLALTVVSPLQQLATEALAWRSLQHLLLIAAIPPWLIFVDPVPTLLAALPTGARAALRRRFRATASLGRAGRSATHAGVIYFLFLSVFWLWYDPGLHAAARENEWLRLLEQATLLGAALLYWWHIAEVAPRWHPPLPPIPRILYTLAGALPIKLVGIILLFSPDSVYDYPAAPGAAAQWVGGGLVWLLGGVAFSWTAALLMRRWLGREADKPPMPHTTWATPEQMMAPGWKRPRS